LIARIRQDRPGMSVIVATAYMDEAQRFDWLVAMDSGKILDTGTPAELLARTGAADLEGAFIGLLPEEKKRGYEPVVIAPLAVDENTPIAIEAKDLTMRFGDFVAVDHVQFKIRRGEILDSRLQWLRQVHDDEDADRSAARQRRTRVAVRSGGGSARYRHPPPRGLHVAGVLALHRTHGAPEPGASRPALSRA
jgi:hypothetical protein